MKNSKLAPYLNTARIVVSGEMSSQKRVFEILGELLSTGLEQIQDTQISMELQARERLGCTALGHGVAIPHCRIDNVTEIRSAIIKLDTGIEFDAPDNKPVDLIFALLVPQQANQEHLETLSELAQFLSNEENRVRLRDCHNAQAILDALMLDNDHQAA
jgi:nitrogen PTS system EIIA component